MSVTAERLMVEVQADVRKALAGLSAVENKANTATSRMSKMARGMGLAFGGAAVLGGIKKTIDLAMSFDTTIRQVGVQTDLSGKALGRLSELAIQMGKDTVFSAQDASGAMLELAKGGLNAAQIRSGALEETLRLAAAGGLDLANAAGYVVQGLNTYGLSAKEAGQVTVALAGGANASTASVETLGQALSQVGPGAVNAGMGIQETVAALALFANRGIKGSDAGTSLKTMLASLVPTTTKAKNAMAKYGLEFVKRNGDFKSMSQVAQELKDGLGKLGDAERTQALKTIFGSDATRAATVLMGQGEKGVRKMIAATKDQEKTQEMANSAMEGAKGALEGFKGSAETAAIQLGTKLLPAFTNALDKGAAFIDEVMTWGPAIQENLGFVEPIARDLFGVFQDGVGIAQSLGGVLGGIPGPIKELGIQAAIAMVVFPRLAGAATAASGRVVGAFTTMSAKARQFGSEMTYAETRSQRLGQAMRGAAGIGAMVLYAQTADSASGKVKLLGSTASGALMGFAAGGPIGAAVGAGAGLLMAWQGAANSAKEAARNAITINEDYAASFDQVTGAVTKAVKATVFRNLSNGDMLTVSRIIGIPDRDMVNAAAGDVDAMARIVEKVKGLTGNMKQLTGPNADKFFFNKERAQQFIGSLKNMGNELTKEQRALLKQIEATKSWGEALKGIPKKVQARLENQGYASTRKQIMDLKKQYDLTPKQVQTIVKALGTDEAKAKAKEAAKEMEHLGKQNPTPKADLNDREAVRKGKALLTQMGFLTKTKAHPTADLNDKATPAIRSLMSYFLGQDGKAITLYTNVVTRRYDAGGGGGGGGGGNGGDSKGMGAAEMEKAAKTVIPGYAADFYGAGQKLATSLAGGFTGPLDAIYRSLQAWSERVTDRYSDIAERASERFANQSEKASNKFERMMDKARKNLSGAAEKARLKELRHLQNQAMNALEDQQDAALDRIERERDKLLKAAEKYQRRLDSFKSAVDALSGGIADSAEGWADQMKTIQAGIRGAFKGKEEAKWLAVVEKANQRLQVLYSERVRVAGLLADAQQKLADIQSQKASFVDSVFSGMNSQATVLNAGNSASAIAANLQAQVAKVQEFAGMLNQLRGMGYSDAIVMQIASAGVEGGWQAAQALISGTAGEVASINQSMKAITDTAAGQANAMGAAYYDAGIATAQATVDGFQSQYDTMTAEINQIGTDLAAAMEREMVSGLTLGGKNAGDGLVKGLQDKKYAINQAVREIADGMLEVLANRLQIHSPSKKTTWVGKMLPAGLVKGIRSGRPSVQKAAGDMADWALPGLGMSYTGSSAGLTGGQAVGGPSFTFVTHNPQAEPQSRTTNKALQRAATMGLV